MKLHMRNFHYTSVTILQRPSDKCTAAWWHPKFVFRCTSSELQDQQGKIRISGQGMHIQLCICHGHCSPGSAKYFLNILFLGPHGRSRSMSTIYSKFWHLIFTPDTANFTNSLSSEPPWIQVGGATRTLLSFQSDSGFGPSVRPSGSWSTMKVLRKTSPCKRKASLISGTDPSQAC